MRELVEAWSHRSVQGSKRTILARQMTTLRKVPTFDEMMWPTLLALKQMGGH
jgi:hypothetical protein